MIKVENLKISFGKKDLFDAEGFNVNKKEKIGLVGRNGSGKTTLFNLLTRQIEPQQGEIIIPKNYLIGYLKQLIEFTKLTVVEEAALGLPDGHKDEIWNVERILSGLGFSDEDMKKAPSMVSSGFQIRLNMAKVLASDPDLLLLDEPTNYLDILSIRWLIRFLRSWKKELIVITHDRGFMDQVTNHTMIIHRRKIRKIPGNTSKMYEQIAKEEETYEKTRINDEKKRRDIEIFISRFRAKARLANSVQSRIKSLQKRIQLKKLENLENLTFSFHSLPLRAKQIMEVKDICFDYSPDSKSPLINNFNMTVSNTERTCIIGKNGKGKTTLLRLLAGILKPLKGEIKQHPNLAAGVYDQLELKKLTNHFTVEEEIMNTQGKNCDRKTARDACGAMMFSGDAALKKISVLSGGERSRVLLGKILLSPVNLLLLDEPTNHLDMESCDSLITAIDNFQGAVIMVTHNEMYLHAIADRLIIFDDGHISLFEGTYRDFLDKGGWKDEETPLKKKEPGEENKLNKKEIRRRNALALQERMVNLKPLENKIQEIEKEINIKEENLNNNNREMISASEQKKGAKINELSIQNHKLRAEIDDLYDKLDKVTQEYEALELKYKDVCQNVC